MYEQKFIRRFWENVNKNGQTMAHMPTPCWEWMLHCQTPSRNGTGGKQLGYGFVSYGYDALAKKMLRMHVHRFAWILLHGVPEGVILHKCDNPKCCNPDHLWEGNRSENVRDAIQKGRHKPFGRDALSPEIVKAVRSDTRTQDECAKVYGISQSSVGRIRRGEVYKDIT